MKFFHLSDLHIGLKLYNRDLGKTRRIFCGRSSGWRRKKGRTPW